MADEEKFDPATDTFIVTAEEAAYAALKWSGWATEDDVKEAVGRAAERVRKEAAEAHWGSAA